MGDSWDKVGKKVKAWRRILASIPLPMEPRTEEELAVEEATLEESGLTVDKLNEPVRLVCNKCGFIYQINRGEFYMGTGISTPRDGDVYFLCFQPDCLDGLLIVSSGN
jgi:hypothetical protein